MSPTDMRQCIFWHLEECTQNGVDEMGGALLSSYVLDLLGDLSKQSSVNESVKNDMNVIITAAKTFPDGSVQAVRRVVGER